MCLGDFVKDVAGDLACPEWEPGNEGNSTFFAIVHDVVPFAIRKAVSVLHGDDGNYPACSFDMLPGNVRQADQANLPLLLQFGQSFERCLERYDRVRVMQLVDVDAIESQSLEAAF